MKPLIKTYYNDVWGVRFHTLFNEQIVFAHYDKGMNEFITKYFSIYFEVPWEESPKILGINFLKEYKDTKIELMVSFIIFKIIFYFGGLTDRLDFSVWLREYEYSKDEIMED